MNIQKGNEQNRRLKIALVIAIEIPVALLHFVTGASYRGPFPIFVNSFLIDILLPFAVYFLLAMQEFSLLKHWYVKAGLVFAFGASVEIAQYFGVPIFGRTFDPLDFIMYATGVLLAALFDTLLFPRIFPFWKTES